MQTHKKPDMHNQLKRALSQSASYRRLSERERQDILTSTQAILGQLAASKGPASDPYATAQAVPSPLPPLPGQGGSSLDAEAIKTGVDQLARFTNQDVNFPAFVAQLIQGVFHAIVTASIEQMKAYGDLVKSVSMSLSDFRDDNVTANQGRDALISRYPDIFTLAKDQSGNPVVDGTGQAKLTTMPGSDMGDLPDFQTDLGLNEEVTDVDDETIESKLVPGARNVVARDRQKLLATTLLMGIQRILVTDGKINAKLRFTFQATDQYQTHAANYDYANLGNDVKSQSQYQSQEDSPTSSSGWDAQNNYSSQYSAKSRYATGAYTYTSTPVLKVASENITDKAGGIQAAGLLSSEVTVNFKSESFPLEKFADSNNMMFLQAAQQGAGRAAPATPPATSTAPAATTTPAPTTTPGG